MNIIPIDSTAQFFLDIRNATQFNGIIFYSSFKNFVKIISFEKMLKMYVYIF